MNPNRKNLANAFLAAPITAAATTMTYVAGYGAGKPAVPYFDTLTPAGQLSTMGNSEIVQVTALSGDTATIVRARKGTTAKAFPAGTIASNGIYVEDKIGSDNIDWATFYPFVYSTTERRVGTWIDGKPLYRRTVTKANMLAGDTITNVLPNGCTMRNVDSTVLVQTTGALYSVNGSFWVTSTGWFSVNYNSSNNTLLFRHGGSDTVTVTSHCYYTKDTD